MFFSERVIQDDSVLFLLKGKGFGLLDSRDNVQGVFAQLLD